MPDEFQYDAFLSHSANGNELGWALPFSKNKERRFIPLRLDDAPIKGFLAQFIYIN